MNTPLHFHSISALADALRSGEVTSVELVQTCIARIRETDSKLRAFITVVEEPSLEKAAQIDAALARGVPLSSLAGIPIGVKDNITTQGIRTTNNSRLLENYVPDYDAPPVARLRAAGAIILGKTNLNEYGWALPSEDDLKPTPYNSWNPKYAAIGSSSGSGSAVSAGLCAGALGTDGGGSARLPAGQQNLISIKPTHGLVSRYRMDDSSFSEISPLTRTVEDTALMLEVMAGYEPADPQSWPEEVPVYSEHLNVDVRGWRIGVPRRYVDTAPLEPETKAAFEDGLNALAKLGIEIVEIKIRGLSEARAANFVALNAETYAKHAMSVRNSPDKYGPSSYTYHLQGAFLSAFDYMNAKKLGVAVREIVQDTLSEYNLSALATPTSPFISAEAARKPGQHRKGLNAIFTAPFNITGHPAMSMPAGISKSMGLPIGMQLVGALYDEMSLLQIAYAYEQATTWHTLHPEI